MAPPNPSSARRTAPAVLLGVLIALGGVGCSRQPSSAAAAAPIRDASAAQTAATTDSAKGPGYQYTIRYPQLPSKWAPLNHAIRAFAAGAKHDIVQSANAANDKNEPPHTLDLDFNIARRTTDFVSVLASGSAYTGGVHGRPIQASFVLYLGDNTLVRLADLFSDPDAALHALSAECRRQREGRFTTRLRNDSAAMTGKQLETKLSAMRRRVEKGTQPVADNFDVFLVDGLDARAIGLTLVFPPYQVASYAEGPQQVEVPAEVFYDLLKPRYRDAFAIDAPRRGAGRG